MNKYPAKPFLQPLGFVFCPLAVGLCLCFPLSLAFFYHRAFPLECPFV